MNKMFFSKVISAAAGIGSIAIVYSCKHLQAKELIDCHECRTKRLPKAKELPLYGKEDDDKVIVYDKSSEPLFLSEVSIVRKKLCEAASYLSAFKNEAVHVYETGLAHSQSTYEYIKSEENKIPRYGAIAAGGLVGYLIARKRGIFKKVIYMSAGTGLVFSTFYPSLAKEYLKSGYEFSKTQGNSFIEYGGYDPAQFSKSVEEKVDLVKSVMKLDGLTSKLNEWFEKSKENVTKSIKNINIEVPKEQSDKPKEETVKK